MSPAKSIIGVVSCHFSVALPGDGAAAKRAFDIRERRNSFPSHHGRIRLCALAERDGNLEITALDERFQGPVVVIDKDSKLSSWFGAPVA